MVNRLFHISALIALFMISSTATAGDVGVEVVFSDREADVIRAYYRDHSVEQRKSGKKDKGLPPGIAKNLHRGKSLPPGIAKKVLPNGLLDLLPPAPRGYERIEVAGKVLLVEVATQVIHDVLEDLILR